MACPNCIQLWKKLAEIDKARIEVNEENVRLKEDLDCHQQELNRSLLLIEELHPHDNTINSELSARDTMIQNLTDENLQLHVKINEYNEEWDDQRQELMRRRHIINELRLEIIELKTQINNLKLK